MGASAEIDEIIHAPIRLRICSILNSVDAIDFSTIKEVLKISESSLSKHIKVLADTGYVSVKKRPSIHRLDSRKITWVKMTKLGKKSYTNYVKTIGHIISSDV